MRKNLLTLMLSVACVFLSAGSFVAEAKISNGNSSRTLNSLNAIRINIPLHDKTLIAKYKKLMQSCGTLMDNCSDAFDHLAWAAGYAYDGCNEYGWDSEYCGELGNWLMETSVWAILQCNQSETKIKPQKLVPKDLGRQNALEKFNFNRSS